jgi:hypothetical protein
MGATTFVDDAGDSVDVRTPMAANVRSHRQRLSAPDPTQTFLSSQSTAGSRSESDAASLLERVCELPDKGNAFKLAWGLNALATQMEPNAQILRAASYIRRAARAVEGLP